MADAPHLKQGVGLISVIALGLGLAVGVSIFSVIAPATALAGPAMLLAVALAAVPMFIIAVTYAFMGSALPTAGASYEWPRRFLSPATGFMIAWLRIAGSVGAMLILALVLTRYVSMLVPVPTKATMLGVFVLIFGLNLWGVAIAARVQTVLMAGLIVLFFVFAGWGAPSVQPESFTPFMSEGWAGVLAATPVLIGLFFGIEAATEVGDEVRNSRRAIPIGVAASIVSAMILYLMVAAVALGVLGPEALAASETPVLDAAAVFMGDDIARPVIVLAAVLAIGKSLNALAMVFSRYLFAMARAGALPASLARVHPRFQTPHIALAVAFGLCVLGLLAPMNLTALFLAVNVPTLLKYGATCLSATRIAQHHPEIHAQAAFRPSRRFVAIWGWLGVVASVVVVLLGLTADWRPYVALTVWGLIGAAWYLVRGRFGVGPDSRSAS
ncbi:MAG: APC family permease [Brevundimonas sp.]|uniref:APC family permease n=1 Tax=Brevundimonas sp. TaxID=1871086 RepID=UPI00391CA505